MTQHPLNYATPAPPAAGRRAVVAAVVAADAALIFLMPLEGRGGVRSFRA